MKANLVIRLKNITEVQSIEVEEFLKKKKINHELHVSAFYAWNAEEAEYKLSEIYNNRSDWGSVNIKKNQTEADFIDDNKECLADSLSDDDYLNESMDNIISDITIGVLKENGYVDETPNNIKMNIIAEAAKAIFNKDTLKLIENASKSLNYKV